MSVPPYLRIAEELGNAITSGRLRPGDRVPSTRQITREWGVAMATATRALAELRRHGLVRAEPGRATVVAGRQAPRPGAGHAPGPGSGSGSGSEQANSDGTRRDTPLGPGSGDLAQRAARERVVRCAIGVADVEGIAAVSMRRLATELDCSTMSLYRYLPGKESLLAGMCDTVFRDTPLPEPRPRQWRQALQDGCRAQWRLYGTHPWLARAVSFTRPLPMPHVMLHTEWMLRALDGLGLDNMAMLHVVVTLNCFVAGLGVGAENEHAAERDSGITPQQWMRERDATFTAILRSQPVPVLTRVTDDPVVDIVLDELFEFGLTRLLDGFDALIRAAAHRAGTPRAWDTAPAASRR